MRFSRRPPVCLSILRGVCIVMTCIALRAFAGAPATLPAVQPATTTPLADAAQSIKSWFDQLADADPNLREQAADRLMQLKAADLSTLRKIAQEELPLTPAQSEALPAIVSQVYLSGQPYEAQPDAGFLGIQTDLVHIASAKDDADSRNYNGILVVKCVSGFCAARSLRAGDVIVEMVESPKLEFIEPEAFKDAVKSHPAGSTIRFQVLRRGQVRDVAITLDPRPLEADTGLQELTQQRQQAFDRYWTINFAPLLKEEVSSAAAPAAAKN